MKKLRFLIAFLLIAVLFSACSGKKSADKEGTAEKVLRVNVATEPGTLDPQILTDSVAIQVDGNIFEGLTRQDKDGNVIPGVAESWDVEGNIWTFKLRKDAKWSNGEFVTANDFAFAWERALNPETASEYSYMLYYIKNAEAYNVGDISDFSKVGIKVVDEYTLEVELEKPAAYFASVLSFPTYYPLNEEFYNEIGEEYALEKGNMLFNGPYVIDSWEHDSKIVLKKNENYWNKDMFNIDQIDMFMINDSNTALNMYLNNELDITGISGDQLPEYKDSSELNTYSDGSVWYLELNTKDKLFSNKKIREAFALAIDRKTLVDVIRKDGSQVATSFVPKGFPGKNKTFREDYGFEIFEDGKEEKAKKLFDEGLAEIGYSGPLTVTLLTGNSDAAQKEGQYYQEQLSRKLGIDVKLEQVTFQIRLQRMTSKDFQAVLAGWGPDYNDPMTYMDLWITTGGNNHTGWSNTEYDRLIDLAYNSSDQEERMDAMAEAEKILLTEFPVVPTFFRSRNALVKPNVKGVIFRAVGSERIFDYADIE